MNEKYFGKEIIIANSIKLSQVKLKHKIKLKNVLKTMLPAGLLLGIFINIFCILVKMVGFIK